MDQCAVATLNQVNREQKGKGINIYILIYINLDEQGEEYNEEERRGGYNLFSSQARHLLTMTLWTTLAVLYISPSKVHTSVRIDPRTSTVSKFLASLYSLFVLSSLTSVLFDIVKRYASMEQNRMTSFLRLCSPLRQGIYWFISSSFLILFCYLIFVLFMFKFFIFFIFFISLFLLIVLLFEFRFGYNRSRGGDAGEDSRRRQLFKLGTFLFHFSSLPVSFSPSRLGSFFFC